MLENKFVNPLGNMDEITCWENRPFSRRWSKSGSDKFTDIKRTIKKKPKRIRTAYTTDQIRTLERIFKTNKYITAERRREIADALNIGDKSVKIWFQNRRMKDKRSSSESSDSSCDTFGDMSSPLPSTEPDTEYLPEQYNFYPNTYQGQVMFCDYRNEEQTVQMQDPSYGMQFYNDKNVHPTQFYPTNDCHYLNDYDYRYQQENNYYNNYWVNTGNSCQFLS